MIKYCNRSFLFLSLSSVTAALVSSCGIGKNSSVLSMNKEGANNQGYCTDLDDSEKNPLGKYQWHLKNTGQSSFASTAGTPGEDINVYDTLKNSCLSGNGVYVAVLDTGLELNHPSLAKNVDNKPHESKTWSMNFRGNHMFSIDPSPLPTDEEDHGTMVSGIIGMRSNLGYGGSGVAPRAHLSGYNIINEDTQSFDNFFQSLGGSDASRNNDIFSMSYGDNNIAQMSETNPLELASLAMYRVGTRELRKGKGAIYVKAAGNGFGSLGGGFKSKMACIWAQKLKLSCQDSNMNLDNAIPEVITVGALNAHGKKTSYSTTGSSLWISAPGGEFSFHKEWINENLTRLGAPLVDWSKKRTEAGDPAIITTDMSSPLTGMSKRLDFDDPNSFYNADTGDSIRNEFNACLVPENSKCMYTNSMNGTSSATPVTSGSIALILEANPNLTWRDVKYILAKTATKVDPNFKGISLKFDNGQTYLAEQGWVNNAAGFHFSNWYGFGRVNVGEAVKLAKNYDVNLGQYIESDWESEYNATNVKIPKEDPEGVTQYLTISNTKNLSIESVQVQISAESKYIGNLAIELTSPSGTKSIVWHAGNAFSSNGNLVKMPIQSNAFYGEESKGKWEIRLINANLLNEEVTFKEWKIKITGHKVAKI